jgi:hypothetical protein
MDEGTKGERAENQETNELFSPNENFGVQVLTSDFTVVNDDDGNSSFSNGRSSMNL